MPTPAHDYTFEELVARAAFAERQADRWNGHAGYARTLRMEAAALRFFAQHTARNNASPDHEQATR